MTKIRVAHIITRLCRGGAQENTFHTVRLHNRDRFEVDLIAGTNTGEEGSLEDDVLASGIEIVRTPSLIRDVSFLKEFRAATELTRLLKDRRYDIVHTHTSKAGFIGRYAAKRVGVPIVVHTPHGNIFDGYFSPARTRVFTAMERTAARWTDRIIELTDGGIEECLEQGIGRREQYTTIFSGIDLGGYVELEEKRASFREELGIDENMVLIGGVGRLEPVKGFRYLVEAALELKGMPNAMFIHAGRGSLESELRILASPLGENFRFLGLRNDIPRVMAGLDLLVVPSLNEGMGRVVLEAGAAGTPVLGSNVGGIPDVVREGETGRLFTKKDRAAIAKLIRELADVPEHLNQLGEAARRFVVPAFSLENMVEHIESLYETLIKEKNLDTRR